jgi:phosphoserine phosphatase
MSLIATLITHPDARALAPSLVDDARRATGASDLVWLKEGVACDLLFDQEVSRDAIAESLSDLTDKAPVDIAVQQAATRRKQILLADMDSTMIDQECIDELADMIGIKDKVADITARSMNGEIAFEPALRERVALLRDLEHSVIEAIIAERITLASGGRTLVATMNAAGAWTALVSGGFVSFTQPISQMLGFKENRANALLVRDGRLTGEVAEPILGREAKAQALREIARRLSLSVEDAIVVGDGANDLDMIQLAGTGVALHAKPTVAAQAPVRIDHGDLTALLYLQGYTSAQFAA